jgi:SET domain-containing protein
MAFLIRSSTIHAAGCYTTHFLPKGSRVLEYDGPRLSKDEADQRYENSPLTYLFGIGSGDVVIDGHSMAMFLNHSCDPNCETDEEAGRIWIHSLRDIQPGEELTYDYNLYDGEDEEGFCSCGALTCRGSMFSPVEIARREKARKADLKKKSSDRNGASQAERYGKATL